MLVTKFLMLRKLSSEKEDLALKKELVKWGMAAALIMATAIPAITGS